METVKNIEETTKARVAEIKAELAELNEIKEAKEAAGKVAPASILSLIETLEKELAAKQVDLNFPKVRDSITAILQPHVGKLTGVSLNLKVEKEAIKAQIAQYTVALSVLNAIEKDAAKIEGATVSVSLTESGLSVSLGKKAAGSTAAPKAKKEAGEGGAANTERLVWIDDVEYENGNAAIIGHYGEALHGKGSAIAWLRSRKELEERGEEGSKKFYTVAAK